ncbi:MAG: GAF domain-containing protein, partial [Propionivibrio sp.]
MSRRIINTLQAWLEDYCRRTSVLTGGVVVESNARGEICILAEWPPSPDGSQILVDTAGIALQRREAGIVVPPIAQGEDGTLRIATLILDEDKTLHATSHSSSRVVALGVNSNQEAVGRSLLTDLDGLRGTLNRLIRSPDSLDAGQAYVLLGLQSALLGETSLAAATLAFVNELNATFGFDRTSLGLVEDGRIRIVALSHNAEFQGKQDLLRALAAAMEEAADQGATLTQPPRPDGQPHILLAHAEFAARAGVSLCSLPLVAGERLIGILSIERRGGTPPSRDDAAQCEHLAALAAPIIELRQQAERPAHKRLFDSFGRFGQRGGHWRGARWALLAAVGVLVVALVLPMPYRVNATARIEGLEQRVLVAPVDGFLRESYVRPGDVVKAGQLLAEMADQDLALEERKWQAELTQHENAYIAAMARTDRAAFSVSRAKANEATAQLELVRSQLARMRIV